MSRLSSLRFEPVYRQYLWGGRRLETELGKKLPGPGVYAESWEVVDHGDDQSVVAAGPCKGSALGELAAHRGGELFGRRQPSARFPLLFKYLDARETLSVQVHPSDEQAALLDPPDLGKTEAWYVVDAAPESVLFAGLKSGVDRPALVQAIERGATDDCLHRVAAKRGDCILIPAGTVHAIGAGMLIAEIQQSSDTTYRLFDWNRVDADGRARPLHVEQALDVIDFDRGPVAPEPPKTTDRGYVERLVECEKFILDRWRIDSQCTIGGDDRFHIISVLSGGVRVEGDPTEVPLRKGQTTLLPGASAAVRLDPESETILLDAYLP